MIFDTDILVWLGRGDDAATRFVEAADARSLSVVSFMELLRGARSRQELAHAKSFLRDYGFRVLPLTENIGHRAAIYIELYGLRVALSVADALVAATAVESGLVLATANRKHFSAIAELQLRVFRPRTGRQP